MAEYRVDVEKLLPVFEKGATATVELEFPDGEDAVHEGTWLKRLKPGSPLEQTLRMARAEIEDRLHLRPEARDDGPFEIMPGLEWPNEDIEQAAALIRRHTSGVLVPLRLIVSEDDGTQAAYLCIRVPDAPGRMNIRVAWLPSS